MNNLNKWIVPALIGLVILFAGLYLSAEFSKSVSFGGLVHNIQEIFVAGLKAGTSATEVINSSGEITGALNLSSGDAATLAGTNTLSGATTLSGTTVLSSTATTTVASNMAFALGKGPVMKVGASCFQLSVATTTLIFVTSTVVCP